MYIDINQKTKKQLYISSPISYHPGNRNLPSRTCTLKYVFFLGSNKALQFGQTSQGFNAADLFPPEMLADVERCKCALTAVLCDSGGIVKYVGLELKDGQTSSHSQSRHFRGKCKQKITNQSTPKKIFNKLNILELFQGNSLTVRCQTTFFHGFFGTVPYLFPNNFLIFSVLFFVWGAFIKKL